MLRIEIDARTRKNEFKASGIMPILYGEAGMAMMLIYRSFRENFPEERAKEMMYRLLERSTLTDEEIEEAEKEQENEEPEIRKAAEATLKYVRNGEKRRRQKGIDASVRRSGEEKEMFIRHSREKKKNHIEVVISGPDIIPKAAEKEIKKALCRIRRLLNKEISFRIVINPENIHPEEE